MDGTTFDRLVADSVRRLTRRAMVRALAGGLRVVPVVLMLLGLAVVAPSAAAETDTDGDGLFDIDETGVYFTNPQLFDTDGDGIGDGEEVYMGTNPLAANAAPVQADSDGDGLFDLDETNVYGTGVYAFDTDGDGVGDGQEVYNGTSPTVTDGSIAAPGQGQCNVLWGDYGCLPNVEQSSAASG
jgi:Bacterial TSP3 repeat